MLKETDIELKMEIYDEGHTFCNLLQDALLQQEDVEMAGYDVPHPLIPKAVVYIRVKKGRSPKTALLKALNKIKEDTSLFMKVFEKAVA